MGSDFNLPPYKTEEIVCPPEYSCVSTELFRRESALAPDDPASDFSENVPKKSLVDAVAALANNKNSAADNLEKEWIGPDRLCFYNGILDGFT